MLKRIMAFCDTLDNTCWFYDSGTELYVNPIHSLSQESTVLSDIFYFVNKISNLTTCSALFSETKLFLLKISITSFHILLSIYFLFLYNCNENPSYNILFDGKAYFLINIFLYKIPWKSRVMVFWRVNFKDYLRGFSKHFTK